MKRVTEWEYKKTGMYSFSIQLLCLRADRTLSAFRVGEIHPTLPLTWRQVGRVIDALEHRVIFALPGRIDAEAIGDDLRAVILDFGYLERGSERFCEGVIKALIQIHRKGETPDVFRYGEDGGLDALYAFLLIP